MRLSADHVDILKARLLTMLLTRSYCAGEFELRYGGTSNFYINVANTALSSEGHSLLGACLLAEVLKFPGRINVVAGVAVGGCSLASAVSTISWNTGRPVDAVYARKDQLKVDGMDHVESKIVVVLEDVVTTGESTLHAIELLEENGFHVAGVIAVVCRDDKGRARIAEKGYAFRSLFTREDFRKG